MPGRRIVVAGPDEGTAGQRAQVLARTLRDAGDEVIFTGPDPSAEQIVLTAIAEDAAAIGLPETSSGLRAEVVALLARSDAEDIDVLDEN